MAITDDLLEGARALRDALDALEFSMKSTVLQRGHVIIPDDEVTGEYLASLPVGLALDERERAAAQLDDLFTVRRETSSHVFFPLTNEHSGKLAVYVLERHDDHTHVNFVLRVRPVDPETL